MSVYFVVELEITIHAAMEPYRAAVGATIEQYGGRFLTRGGATELIEGVPEPKRIVILEFADTAVFKRWYNSPEYQKILPGRLDPIQPFRYPMDNGDFFHRSDSGRGPDCIMVRI